MNRKIMKNKMLKDLNNGQALDLDYLQLTLIMVIEKFSDKFDDQTFKEFYNEVMYIGYKD